MAGHLILVAVFFQVIFLQESSSSAISSSGSSAISSSCRITPVEEGGTAVVTCSFDKNINETMRGFQVDRYSTMEKTQESLLDCHWFNGQLECQKNARVRYDGIVTNTVTVHIPYVTYDDVRKYVCYVLPILNGTSKSCNLILIDNNTTTHHMPNTSDSSIIKELAAIRDSIDETRTTSNFVLTLSAIASLVIITLTCIALLVLCRKYVLLRFPSYQKLEESKANP